MTSLHRVILDTDIGSDVDDLMALALILGTPTVDLVGITTVYGDTALRARLAQRVLTLAGADAPVHAGIQKPLSGRDVWWAGHEGDLYPELEKDTYDSDDAVRFLVDTVTASPGELDVIAIGPLTNIAAAITADPAFASSVRHLWVMGGDFAAGEAEHNFVSDVDAATIVFDAGIPTTITGLEITRQLQIARDDLDRIAAAGDLGATIRAEIEQWWAFWNTEWNVPHDPITVLTLTEPHLFTLSSPGHVKIGSGDTLGVSTLNLERGATRVVTGIDIDGTRTQLVDGIIEGSTRTAVAGSAG
ncbi:nucleoside hydrolase [Microbacterium gorillae]|uniref:nucleoside hydrolase n=1 Tax=Microbacterium gorillae TaxID=1231063 RepID=UPI003D99241D